MKLELYTQPFCAPCIRTRQTVARAQALLPDLQVEEINVVEQVQRGEELGITSTPVIRLMRGSTEKFRASDTPTLPQLLAAIARASD
ncbi:thioredoxin [Glutamicibacter halophytocola]|uniref:Thioredoxin n=1 Tax=Glutamicibacter halophytocola TaxID=1933880 RepID=A0ABX5Y7S4_9MICC|nr:MULTISPECIES: thioredoxin [Glutamicibacter]MBF6672883.1 thioredoxin [Glutamicibacter sp. FBE19]QDY66168.1 thioredoxin [Glutamicibacter halophytocola]